MGGEAGVSEQVGAFYQAASVARITLVSWRASSQVDRKERMADQYQEAPECPG